MNKKTLSWSNLMGTQKGNVIGKGQTEERGREKKKDVGQKALFGRAQVGRTQIGRENTKSIRNLSKRKGGNDRS